jgi:hypothetical protein
MKKRILTLLSVAALFVTAAQAQVSFAVRAGIGLQNINGKAWNGDALTNDPALRWHIGGLVNIPVATDFNVQTGLIFNTKGASYTSLWNGNERVQDIHLNYLEVPFNFTYTPQLGTGRLLLGFGPYLAYGLGGRIVTEGSSPNQAVVWQNSVATSDTGNVYYKPLELGANFLFGYEFARGLQVQLNAQLGLTEINPTDARVNNNKASWKNTGFGISLGWRF